MWAEGEVPFTKGNTIGAVDNSNGWYGGMSEVIEIPANKTLTLKFKTYSATDDQLTAAGAGNWGAHMSHVINLWTADTDYGNLFWRADGYGWWDEKNTNVSGWYTFLGANTRWGTDGAEFREDITGSDVVLTVQRVGAELRMTQDFTATSGKYRRYFVVNYGPADGSIWSQLAIERAHVEVTENYSVTETEKDPTISGTQIGLANNTTAFWTAWSDYFTIEPEGSLTLKYKAYTNRVYNWNGGVAYVTTDADRGASGYTEYFGLRPDNWVNVVNTNATSNFDEISWDWATFREKVDGSTVTLTITRSGSTVTVREEFAPADASTTLWEEYSQSCDDGTQNIRVFLAAEGAHLDLLPVTKSITDAGWATYCSPYALDLASATGLTDAYIVTGGAAGVLAKTSVKGGTVPANTGLLLKGTEGSAVEVTIPIVGSSTTDVSANKLVGVTASQTLTANGGYVLMSSPSLGFYKNNNDFTLGANTAYLPSSFDGGGSREFFSIDDVTTGIKSVQGSGLTVNGFYDLQGRRVAQPQKGLYIVNGKKVVIK